MSATLDPRAEAPTTRSRRALLAGALGGIGAWTASAIGRAGPARAANGETVTVGGSFDGTTTTTITKSGSGSAAIAGKSTGGYGLYGESSSAYGVYAWSTSGWAVYGQTITGIGVVGSSSATDMAAIQGQNAGHSTGVLGYSGDEVPPAAKAKTGVYGHAAQDSSSRGVWGRANAGQGVRGQATSGVGVYGKATTGLALQAVGRAKFSTSGVATIAAGSDGVTVTPGVNVTSASFVLLTPKSSLGGRDLWFTTNATADTFRIRISSPRASATKVAWLLLG